MQGGLNEKYFQLYLLAFFQKCKQGYFPWYNIGVNSERQHKPKADDKKSVKSVLKGGKENGKVATYK